MRPCARNQKALAWLALGELDARTATALRAQLEGCDGCRRYFTEISGVTEKLASTEVPADIGVSESFHRRVVARLGAEESGSIRQALAAPFMALRLNWRVALPVSAAAAVAIVLLVTLVRQPTSSQPTPHMVEATPPSDLKSDLPPTVANYQRIASRSLDDLDELLTLQSRRNPPAIPSYTASFFASAQTLN